MALKSILDTRLYIQTEPYRTGVSRSGAGRTNLDSQRQPECELGGDTDNVRLRLQLMYFMSNTSLIQIVRE